MKNMPSCMLVFNIEEKDKTINDRAGKLSPESVSSWFKDEETGASITPPIHVWPYFEIFRKVSLDSGLIIKGFFTLSTKIK